MPPSPAPTHAAQPAVEFRVLGAVSAWAGDRTVPLGSPKQRCLLAILLLDVNQSVHMERLVDLLWGESPIAKARGTVQAYVSRLRRAFADHPDVRLRTAGQCYVLDVDADRVDLHRFRRLVAEARTHARGEHLPPGRSASRSAQPTTGQPDGPIAGSADEHAGASTDERRALAAELLRQALSLWRGAPLDDVAPPHLRETVCAGLVEERLAAWEEHLDISLALGRHRDVVGELSELVGAHPLRERPAMQLMTALHRSGRRADALDQYQRLRRRLRDELGVDPSPDVTALHQAILRNDPTLRPPAAEAHPNSHSQQASTQQQPADRLARDDTAITDPVGHGMDRASSDHSGQRTISARDRSDQSGSSTGPSPSASPPTSTTHSAVPASETQPLASPVVTEVSAPATALPVPAQLPHDLPTFTGRHAELELLAALVPGAGGPRVTQSVVVGAIDGMTGVGKTALALHWAHQVRDAFPDGQLFLDLHGYSRDTAPVDPADALDRLLRALGVPGDRIPANTEDRTALYRTRLAGRRILVLLDNAASEAQVRPLLPGAPGCLALVTSQRRLAGLDDAHVVSLDVPPWQDAVRLFTRAAGAARVAGEPAALLGEVVELCGRLPLALRVAASRLRHRPGWTLAHLVERLRDQYAWLSDTETGQRTPAAAFHLAYQQLPPDEQRMFRRLGTHPGSTIDRYAAAAVAEVSLREAARTLDELVDAHLVDEQEPGRYGFHDLLRIYAGERARTEDTDAERHTALTRLFDYYAHTASAAMDELVPHEPHTPPATMTPPAAAPPFRDDTAALSWLDTERDTLLAVAAHAANTADAALATYPSHLSSVLWRYFDFAAHHHEALTLHGHALRATRRGGDRNGEATALLRLGTSLVRLGRNQDAADHVERALSAYRDAGNRDGQARALGNLAIILEMLPRFDEVLECARQALALYTELGDRDGESRVLGLLGRVLPKLGRGDEALPHLDRALALSREVGDRNAEAEMLSDIGILHRKLEHPDAAIDHIERAIALSREIGDRNIEGQSLPELSRAHLQLGHMAEAVACARRALDLAGQVGDRNIEFESHLALADALRQSGDLNDSLHHALTAVNIARSLDQTHDEARALTTLGHVHRDRGEVNQAQQSWRSALRIFTDLDTPDSDQVEALLADLPEVASSTPPAVG